jgi:hypothetical protein
MPPAAAVAALRSLPKISIFSLIFTGPGIIFGPFQFLLEAMRDCECLELSTGQLNARLGGEERRRGLFYRKIEKRLVAVSPADNHNREAIFAFHFLIRHTFLVLLNK